MDHGRLGPRVSTKVPDVGRIGSCTTSPLANDWRSQLVVNIGCPGRRAAAASARLTLLPGLRPAQFRAGRFVEHRDRAGNDGRCRDGRCRRGQVVAATWSGCNELARTQSHAGAANHREAGPDPRSLALAVSSAAVAGRGDTLAGPAWATRQHWCPRPDRRRTAPPKADQVGGPETGWIDPHHGSQACRHLRR